MSPTKCMECFRIVSILLKNYPLIFIVRFASLIPYQLHIDKTKFKTPSIPYVCGEKNAINWIYLWRPMIPMSGASSLPSAHTCENAHKLWSKLRHVFNVQCAYFCSLGISLHLSVQNSHIPRDRYKERRAHSFAF